MNFKIKYYLQIADSALIYSYRLRELSIFNTHFLNSLSSSDLTDELMTIATITYQEVSRIQEKEEGQPFDIIRTTPEQYFNAILFELENKDELFVIIRLFFVDTFHSLYYHELIESKDIFLAKLAKENVDLFTSQVEKSRLWFKELKFSDEQAHNTAQKSMDVLWEYSADIFQASRADLVMISLDIGVDLHKIQQRWKIEIETAIVNEGFIIPEQAGSFIGGKEGRHSRSFHSFLRKEIVYLSLSAFLQFYANLPYPKQAICARGYQSAHLL
jgi:ring-1,2-phenylacetyl-CoA epoxidase subunit PaaC